MRAVQITRFGGPEVLEIVDVPEPEAGRGQTLYDVSTAGVNYADTHHQQGARQTILGGCGSLNTIVHGPTRLLIQACVAVGFTSPLEPRNEPPRWSTVGARCCR